eukprot:19945-Heterococcus_DN1.PRE.3
MQRAHLLKETCWSDSKSANCAYDASSSGVSKIFLGGPFHRSFIFSKWLVGAAFVLTAMLSAPALFVADLAACT